MPRIDFSATVRLLLAGTAVLSVLPAAAQTPNALSAEEAAAGWQLLFNGTSNEGWVRPNGSPGQFAIEENALRNAGGDICTQADYEDFEFSFDYKYGPNANSGVFIRTRRGVNPPYNSGVEIAIQDNGRADTLHTTGDGAVYAIKAPSVDKWTGPEKWNSMRIRVAGSRLENHHNGDKVIDMDMASEEWKALVAASKFASWPLWGKDGRGQICLQDHGSAYKVLFRNIKVRVLPAGAAVAPGPKAPGLHWEIHGSGSDRLLAVEMPGGRDLEVSLFDVNGRESRSGRGRSSRAILPLGNLRPGIYWLRVESPAGRHERRIALLQD